jgi:tRNA A-37 threonylcarbamoyl transferase component Bud32
VNITSATPDTALLELPLQIPLARWPQDRLVSLPRGISRHTVRFVRLGEDVYAVKEIDQRLAVREYGLLRTLERIDAPAVQPVAVVTDRQQIDGTPLESVLITHHLRFSLPYRALFSHTLRPDTMARLLDALAALLVRLHLAGFFWGDVSLSNTLFRRDAGAFAAYVVDVETGAVHPQLSDGQRSEDLELARVNIFGEMLDLQAGGLLSSGVDAEQVADDVVNRYETLWRELTYEDVLGTNDVRHYVSSRIRRLNELGFDLEELQMSSAGDRYRVRPKVVDAGHHSRRLLRLTGIDAEENQARLMLNDLDTYRADNGLEDEQLAAHRWVADVFEPIVRGVPESLRGKLEPTEVFVQVLEHRWYLSERAGRDVGLIAALEYYVSDVLAHRPDEKAVLGFTPTEIEKDTADTLNTADEIDVSP